MKTFLWIVSFGVAFGVASESTFAVNIINVADFGDGSGSLANAQAAYDKSAAGDTIVFPAGNWTWSSALTIKKPLTVMGNGATLTAGATLNNGFFYVTGFQSESLMRITGFTFNLVDLTGSAIKVLDSKLTLSNLRIDHNTFLHGYVQIEVGGSKGVLDNNNFFNGNSGIYFTAGSREQADASWLSLAAGTADALFVEDNVFMVDTNFLGPQQNNQCIDTYNGGKLVVRYNSFISTNPPPTATETFRVIQNHGSAAAGVPYGYWQKASGARRGQSVVEIYNNTVKAKRADFLTVLRSGAQLIHDNVLDTTMYTPRIYAYEEEQYESQWSPNRVDWPAEDQVHNTFLWNNTLRLNGVTNNDYFDVAVSSTNFIQKGRDYWLHAPQASGGYEYFIGTNGASSSYPTDGKMYPTFGTMIFTNDGPNAYYGYSPYTYPHPLRLGELSVLPIAMAMARPAPVANLRVAAPMNLWISQTQNDSYFDTTDGILSQSIDGSVPKTINRIDLLMYNFTNPQTVTVDIRTAVNGGGKTLGSCTHTVSTGGDSEWIPFYMPNVSISNTVYITLTSSDRVRWRIAAAGGIMYGGTTYCVNVGESAVSSQDFCIKVYSKE